MSDLVEKVGHGAVVWGHFYDGKLSSVTTKKNVAESWARVFGDQVQPLVPARAAIAVCAEEMAQEVLRHGDTWSGTRDVTQACQESAVDDKVIEIAAAIRSMGERG